MPLISWRVIVAALLLLNLGQSALATNRHRDINGFSFNYPGNWLLLDRASVKHASKTMPPDVKHWLAKNNIDFSKAVFLVRFSNSPYVETVNVTIDDKEQVPANESSLNKGIGALREELARMGMTIETIQGRVQKYGVNDTLTIDSQIRVPGIPFPLRQRQVMFPGGGKTYFVTCLAKADAFDVHLPTFELILNSFQVPPLVRSGNDVNWKGFFSGGVQGGIIGVIVGGLVGLIGKFMSKSGS